MCLFAARVGIGLTGRRFVSIGAKSGSGSLDKYPLPSYRVVWNGEIQKREPQADLPVLN
jgi:hypothetical protein